MGSEPRWLITDKLRSYGAAHRNVMPSVEHVTARYANNRAEVSHQPTRQRGRQMRRFKSVAQAQRFLSVHGVVRNLFSLDRRRLRSHNHRLLRGRAFAVWTEVTAAGDLGNRGRRLLESRGSEVSLTAPLIQYVWSRAILAGHRRCRDRERAGYRDALGRT